MPHISPIFWIVVFLALSLLFWTQVSRLGSYNPSLSDK